MDNLETVYIKLRNDAEFAKAFQANPEKALQDAHLEISADDFKKIQSFFKLDDGLLGNRINK